MRTHVLSLVIAGVAAGLLLCITAEDTIMSAGT